MSHKIPCFHNYLRAWNVHKSQGKGFTNDETDSRYYRTRSISRIIKSIPKKRSLGLVITTSHWQTFTYDYSIMLKIRFSICDELEEHVRLHPTGDNYEGTFNFFNGMWLRKWCCTWWINGWYYWEDSSWIIGTVTGHLSTHCNDETIIGDSSIFYTIILYITILMSTIK